jgi:GntR family transcriptional regulator
MFFHVDPSGDLAIYEQLVRQVKFAVADEVLKPGELVPSVREVARDLAINPNTVARAYRELQTERVLETVRGTGLAVAAGAVRRCRADRVKLIRARLHQVLLEAKQSRLDRKELQTLIDEELAAIESKEVSA